MSTHVPRQPSRSLRWWIWVGYWFTLFIMTHIPIKGVGVLARPHADKVIHVGIYFALVWLGARQRRLSGRPLSRVLLLGWALIYMAYAAADEWLQSFVGRTMSLGDWLADTLGIGLATALLILLSTRQGLSEPDAAQRP